MGKKQRDKGKRGEYELERLLQKFGFEAWRGSKAQAGGDIKLPDVVLTNGNYTISVEVKRRKRVGMNDVMGGYEQAIEGAAGMIVAGMAEPPVGYVVAHRSDRSEWFVTMDMDSFVSLLSGKRFGVVGVLDTETNTAYGKVEALDEEDNG